MDSKYPDFSDTLHRLSRTRPYELLQKLTASDASYAALRQERAQSSAELLRALPGEPFTLDRYTEAVFAQECYELEAAYRQGFTDALSLIYERGGL